jgi:hypothetical protein
MKNTEKKLNHFYLPSVNSLTVGILREAALLVPEDPRYSFTRITLEKESCVILIYPGYTPGDITFTWKTQKRQKSFCKGRVIFTRLAKDSSEYTFNKLGLIEADLPTMSNLSWSLEEMKLKLSRQILDHSND